MEGPLISLDVSKGKSNYRCYDHEGDRKGRLGAVSHDLPGLSSLLEDARKMEERTGRRPYIVLEATGIYSNVVREFFLSRGFTAYVISPLLSARMRKESVRSAKNDSLDTRSIAGVFYSKDDLVPYARPSTKESDLRLMSDRLDVISRRLRMLKNQYLRLLDMVWPCLDEMKSYESKFMLDFVIGFGHPSEVKMKKGILSVIRKTDVGSAGGKDDIAGMLLEFSRKCLSPAGKDSYAVVELIESSKELKECMKEKKEMVDRMDSVASTMKEHGLLMTIPCVATINSIRLLSRIGDISRFDTPKSLVAYAGIDPHVYQSGRMTGEHRSITKKGDPNLRATLYLIVKSMLKHRPDSKIARYVRGKIKNGTPKKVAVIAGCNKLARIIHTILSQKVDYSENG